MERVSTVDGKTVEWDDIEKGYEISKGKFVIVDDADFKAAAVQMSRVLEMTDFVPGESIDPRFFDTPYFLVPQKGGEKAYVLFRDALEETGKVGIGTFALAQVDPKTFHISPVDFATVNDVISVLELRISLETEAAGLAAQRRTPENLKTLQQALDTFEDAVKNNSEAVPSDFQFHLEIAKATGNRHFADLMTYLGENIIPRTRVNTPARAQQDRASYLRRVNSEHQNILSAIRSQDADAARAAMRLHLSNSQERLRKSQAA